MLTTTIFIAPDIISEFVVWTIPCRAFNATLPSSLYTLSAPLSGTDLARDCLVFTGVSPNLTGYLSNNYLLERPNFHFIKYTNSWYTTNMSKSLTRSETIYKLRNPSGDPFDYKPNKNKILAIIGLLLWITEGDKTQLSLSNGNPSIIKRYLDFLRNICNLNEKKIKAVIHCHDTLPYKKCLSYWSNLTNIPKHRFTKPHIKKDRGGNRKYPNGIIRIAASNNKLVRIFNERLKELNLYRD